jgi:hypothetical protein
MSSITETAQAFFEACEAGKGWSICRTWCAPDATFAEQAKPQGLMTVLTGVTYDVKSFATDSSARRCVARFVGVLFAASLLAGPMASFAARAQTSQPAPAPSAAPQPSTEEAAKREVWRATIARTPAPKKGCFTASYPNAEWQEVPCGRPSPYPNPARRRRPDVVGDTLDFAAQASGLISSAVGSFASVTPATITEQGLVLTQQGCQPPPRCAPNAPHCQPLNPHSEGGLWCTQQRVDAFSLQLNSQFFELNSPFELSAQASQIAACLEGSAVCGWEQFVFSQYGCPGGPCVFIQYWLLNYGPTSPPPPSACATPWMNYGIDWYCNSSSTIVPHMSAAQLQEAAIIGTAAADGDTAVLAIAGDAGLMAASGGDTMLNLAQHWNAVEWGVFGDCCGFEAGFSGGSTLVVKTSVDGGAVATCVQEGFTAETNNLSLGGTSAQDSTPPAIVFTQSDAAGGTPASCIFAAEGGHGKPQPHGGPGGGVCGREGLPPCPHQ